MDTIVALKFIQKDEVEVVLTKVSSRFVQQIWSCLTINWIITTVEYLPSILNVEADFKSRLVTNWSKWKLNQAVFREIRKALWTHNVDLFVSRVSHLVQTYITCKPEPFSKGTAFFNIPGII